MRSASQLYTTHAARAILIGFGNQMLNEYVPALRRLKVGIASICEPSSERQTLARSEGHAKIFGNISEVPTADGGELVIVAVPHSVGPNVLTSIVDKGYKKILIEKPPALSLKIFDSVVDRIERSETSVFVATKRRYLKPYSRMRDLIQERVPRALNIQLYRTFSANSFGWRANPAIAGKGVFYDLGYHAIDLAMWLLGDATDIEVRNVSVGRGYKSSSHLTRACIELRSPSWLSKVTIDIDRLAPSPFEQIVADYQKDQFIAKPDIYFNYKKNSPNQYEPETFSDNVHLTEELLANILFDKTPQLGKYAEHQSHLAIIREYLNTI